MVKKLANKSVRRWSSAAARRMLALAGGAQTIEEAVLAVAAQLLRGVDHPPTDLNQIMARLNVISCVPVDGLPLSGELRTLGNHLEIVYSPSLSPGRRRFTIAHELAHAVFHTTGRNCPRFGHELERICDLLATELLMPRDAFLAAADSLPNPNRILALARGFDASLMATALRCHSLCGVSVFQTEAGKLAWGYGIVRSASAIRDDGIKELLAAASAEQSGELFIPLVQKFKAAMWRAQWRSLSADRSIFLLRPFLRDRRDLGTCGVRRLDGATVT